MKSIYYILIIILPFLFSCKNEESIMETEEYDFSDRTYEISSSHLAGSQTPVPLIIVLHGSGSSALSMIQATNFNTIAGESGYLIIYPNAYQGRWNFGDECEMAYPERPDDIEFIKFILKELDKTFNIDKNRIYITGYSLGGFFTYYLARKLPEITAAIAPVAATMPRFISNGSNPNKTPALIILGNEDASVNYQGSGPGNCNNLSGIETARYWASVNGCNLEPETTYLPDNGIDYLNIRIDEFKQCSISYASKLVTVEGGGHRWYMNNEINTSQIIFNFFQSLSSAK